MIHINIGSNLESRFGNRFENISIASNLLIDSKKADNSNRSAGEKNIKN